MIAFLAAIAGASLLGSLHCVGMCGPFAIWASGDKKSCVTIGCYHLGRLTTFLSAGLLAGLVGSALRISGEAAGLQSLAAKIAGTMLIVIGVLKLFKMTRFYAAVQEKKIAVEMANGNLASPKKSVFMSWLSWAKPILENQGANERAYLGGLLTTWLPCGWLYLFVLIAAGTGSVSTSLLTMFAFWLGTLPALTGLALGVQSLSPRIKTWLPMATSLLLIITGFYTATGRAAVQLSNWNPEIPLSVSSTHSEQSDGDPAALTVDTELLNDQLPPCCRTDEDSESK